MKNALKFFLIGLFVFSGTCVMTHGAYATSVDVDASIIVSVPHHQFSSDEQSCCSAVRPIADDAVLKQEINPDSVEAPAIFPDSSDVFLRLRNPLSIDFFNKLSNGALATSAGYFVKRE